MDTLTEENYRGIIFAQRQEMDSRDREIARLSRALESTRRRASKQREVASCLKGDDTDENINRAFDILAGMSRDDFFAAMKAASVMQLAATLKYAIDGQGDRVD